MNYKGKQLQIYICKQVFGYKLLKHAYSCKQNISENGRSLLSKNYYFIFTN